MNPSSHESSSSQDPLHAWEEFIEETVYPTPGKKAKADYRNYDNPGRDTVREFDMRRIIGYQTLEFVRQNRHSFLCLTAAA